MTNDAQQPEPEATAEGNPIEADAVEGLDGVKLSAGMLTKYGKEWGYENAVRWLCEENLSVDHAKERYYQTLREENERLKVFAQAQAVSVDFIPSDDASKIQEARVRELVKSGINHGQAEYIAKNRR